MRMLNITIERDEKIYELEECIENNSYIEIFGAKYLVISRTVKVGNTYNERNNVVYVLSQIKEINI